MNKLLKQITSPAISKHPLTAILSNNVSPFLPNLNAPISVGIDFDEISTRISNAVAFHASFRKSTTASDLIKTKSLIKLIELTSLHHGKRIMVTQNPVDLMLYKSLGWTVIKADTLTESGQNVGKDLLLTQLQLEGTIDYIHSENLIHLVYGTECIGWQGTPSMYHFLSLADVYKLTGITRHAMAFMETLFQIRGCGLLIALGLVKGGYADRLLEYCKTRPEPVDEFVKKFVQDMNEELARNDRGLFNKKHSLTIDWFKVKTFMDLYRGELKGESRLKWMGPKPHAIEYETEGKLDVAKFITLLNNTKLPLRDYTNIMEHLVKLVLHDLLVNHPDDYIDKITSKRTIDGLETWTVEWNNDLREAVKDLMKPCRIPIPEIPKERLSRVMITRCNSTLIPGKKRKE